MTTTTAADSLGTTDFDTIVDSDAPTSSTMLYAIIGGGICLLLCIVLIVVVVLRRRSHNNDNNSNSINSNSSFEVQYAPNDDDNHSIDGSTANAADYGRIRFDTGASQNSFVSARDNYGESLHHSSSGSVASDVSLF
jgi:hypothetical protein